MNDALFVEKHLDVSEEEGCITIPHGKLPNVWKNSPDIQSLHSLDRSFVFTGEQVHILACLSACGQDAEVKTPFKVDAEMSKNGKGHSIKGDNAVENSEASYDGNFHAHNLDSRQSKDHSFKGEFTPAKDISDGESLTEDQKRKMEIALQRLQNSHFFVRFADSDDVVWSKRTSCKISSTNPSRRDARDVATISINTNNHLIEQNETMNFNENSTGGMARNSCKCFSLTNGDIVVVLQVNIGDDFFQDPFLEICQFERHSAEGLSDEKDDDLLNSDEEPCRQLLTWLFPLDNTLPSHTRSRSTSPLSLSGNGSTYQRSNYSSSSGSQIFSFGNFRSYSMSSLPQSTVEATTPSTTLISSTSKFEMVERDQYSGRNLLRSQRGGKEGLLSFRGVLLEPKRFSVCCGLEGVYIPGRRWRRKIQVIRPVEIHSFPTVCNTDDLLCVQIKNVCPSHTPEIVVYIDAITIVLEETTRRGPPLSLPIASMEVGDGHTLPNLPLRIGEEHSFILKPAISTWRKHLSHDRTGAQSSKVAHVNALKRSNWMKLTDGKETVSNTDCYSIMVSCRCSASESRLFFRQPTNWKPRVSSDIMISVACKMSTECSGPNWPVSRLPVQVLTLKASNLTSEDLTMTMLAPASFTSPPSVLSLNSSPTSPTSPLTGLSYASVKSRNQAGVVSLQSENDQSNYESENKAVSLHDQASPVAVSFPSAGFGCSHLWLQSRVPLGCVPAQSTSTMKVELLPLTDGIITLDTLQIDVKERGVAYVPEHSLKIIAASNISAGIS